MVLSSNIVLPAFRSCPENKNTSEPYFLLIDIHSCLYWLDRNGVGFFFFNFLPQASVNGATPFCPSQPPPFFSIEVSAFSLACWDSRLPVLLDF